MNKNVQAKFRAQADIMKALSHPTRLFIVTELSKGERCVCKITEMIGADISTVSKHLLLLKNTGIIADEKRGQKVFYKLKIPCALNFLTCVGKILKARSKTNFKLAGA